MAWIADDNEEYYSSNTVCDIVIDELIKSHMNTLEKHKSAYLSVLRNTKDPMLKNRIKGVIDIVATHMRELALQSK